VTAKPGGQARRADDRHQAASDGGHPHRVQLGRQRDPDGNAAQTAARLRRQCGPNSSATQTATRPNSSATQTATRPRRKRGPDDATQTATRDGGNARWRRGCRSAQPCVQARPAQSGVLPTSRPTPTVRKYRKYNLIAVNTLRSGKWINRMYKGVVMRQPKPLPCTFRLDQQRDRNERATTRRHESRITTRNRDLSPSGEHAE
jgi:hypothetical protein